MVYRDPLSSIEHPLEDPVYEDYVSIYHLIYRVPWSTGSPEFNWPNSPRPRSPRRPRSWNCSCCCLKNVCNKHEPNSGSKWLDIDMKMAKDWNIMGRLWKISCEYHGNILDLQLSRNRCWDHWSPKDKWTMDLQQEKYEYWSLLVSDHWSFQAAYKQVHGWGRHWDLSLLFFHTDVIQIYLLHKIISSRNVHKSQKRGPIISPEQIYLAGSLFCLFNHAKNHMEKLWRFLEIRAPKNHSVNIRPLSPIMSLSSGQNKRDAQFRDPRSEPTLCGPMGLEDLPTFWLKKLW